MHKSVVKARWRQGKCATCTMVHLTDPSVAELVGLMGFDCVWFDLEHHVTSSQAAGAMMRAVRVSGADSLARPAKGEFMRMGRLLEAGATGVLYPRCDDAAEARQVVQWAKFAPAGQRGYDGSNADNLYGGRSLAEYARLANEETFVAVQVESPQALPHARAMAEVEGVDMLFFGPADFSLLAGVPGQFESDTVLKAAEEVARGAIAAGKHFGTIAFGV